MCAVCPSDPFPVAQTRLDKAIALIKQARAVLTEDEAVFALSEVGLLDGLITEAGQSKLDLTSLQLVSYAAALAAIIETKTNGHV